VKPTALNYTASDTNLQSCWYSLDSGATNTSVACGTNVTGLSAIEGSNTWQIWANDTLNNANSSSVTFYVDSVPPAINFTNPSETSGSFVNRNFIKINVTASDSGSGLKNITIRLYNSSRSLINSTNQTSSPLFSNFTGLSDGRYFFNSTAYDNFGNANSTETRNVTIDTIYPVVSIVLPTNNADFPNFISSVTIDANFSVSDTNLQSCKYDITGPQNITNLTTACSNGYNAFSYTIISPGSFTLRVYSNDSAGNENMSSINFTVTRYAGQQQGGGGSNTHVQQSATYDRAIICPSALTFISDHTKNGTLNYTAQEFTILVNQISASLKFEAQESVIKPFVNNFASYCSEYLVNPPENTTTPTPPVQPPKEEGFNYIPLLIFVVAIIVIIIIVIILSSTNNIIEVKHEKRIEGGYKYGK
ncbi:MAG: hypothetical protein NT076_03620, partial [Candidatus Pacearchaeota archaeon]|nr:hypothetical protein [Candidatus Pacearchaeota archaeon]